MHRTLTGRTTKMTSIPAKRTLHIYYVQRMHQTHRTIRTAAFQVNMHLKWIFWTIFRVALPLYLFYHVFWVVFPVYRFSKWYINVSYIGAIAICFFCVSAYSLVIMPPIVTQVGNDCLERTSSKTDLAPATNGADTATDLETGNGEEMKADPPAPAVSCDDAPLNRSGDYQVATEIKHEEKH